VELLKHDVLSPFDPTFATSSSRRGRPANPKRRHLIQRHVCRVLPALRGKGVKSWGDSAPYPAQSPFLSPAPIRSRLCGSNAQRRTSARISTGRGASSPE